MPPVIVVGAGLAGWTTVREFRKLDASTPVLLITTDSGDSSMRTALPAASPRRSASSALMRTAGARLSGWAFNAVARRSTASMR